MQLKIVLTFILVLIFGVVILYLLNYKTSLNEVNFKLGVQDSDTVIILDLKGQERFFKNNKNVWVLGEMPPEPMLIPGADPITFTPLIYPYSRDSKSVFCWTELIPLADASTFEVLEGKRSGIDSYYSRDKSGIYYCGLNVEGADPDTFVTAVPSNGELLYDAQDKNQKYYQGEPIKS